MPKKANKGLGLFSCVKTPIQQKAEHISKPNMLDDLEKKILEEVSYNLPIVKKLPEDDKKQSLLRLMECIIDFAQKESLPDRINILKGMIVEYEERIEQISPSSTQSFDQSNQNFDEISLSQQQIQAFKLKSVTEKKIQQSFSLIKPEDLNRNRLKHVIKSQKTLNKKEELSELEQIFAKRLADFEGNDVVDSADVVNSANIFCEENLSENKQQKVIEGYEGQLNSVDPIHSQQFSPDDITTQTVDDSNQKVVTPSLFQQQIQASKLKLKKPVIQRSFQKHSLAIESHSEGNDVVDSANVFCEENLSENNDNYRNKTFSERELKLLSTIFEEVPSQRNSKLAFNKNGINYDDSRKELRELEEFEQLEKELNKNFQQNSNTENDCLEKAYKKMNELILNLTDSNNNSVQSSAFTKNCSP